VDAEEDLWWARLAERLRAEADGRGGRAVAESDYVRLDPPADEPGEPIYLTRHDDGLCKLEVGLLTSFMANFVYFDDQNGILPLVLGVLKGHATESVDVSATGEWIGVRSAIEKIEHGEGRSAVRSHRPAPGQEAALPAAHNFSRRIKGWGGIRFLSLEEAVRLGVTDEEGNFLDQPPPRGAT
jgi:hypothetical protein